MAFLCPLRVLLHHLAEERGDIIASGVFGVTHVLPVVVASLERVILNRDQVEGHIIESGFSGCHEISLSIG